MEITDPTFPNAYSTSTPPAESWNVTVARVGERDVREFKEVLVLFRGRWTLGRYVNFSGEWQPRGSNSDFSDEITEWMPLPNGSMLTMKG